MSVEFVLERFSAKETVLSATYESKSRVNLNLQDIKEIYSWHRQLGHVLMFTHNMAAHNSFHNQSKKRRIGFTGCSSLIHSHTILKPQLPKRPTKGLHWNWMGILHLVTRTTFSVVKLSSRFDTALQGFIQARDQLTF